MQNLLNQFLGAAGQSSQGLGAGLNSAKSNMPGGLAGGAVAGGLVALLMSNKSARKFAGKTAKIGGAAVLGGMAYKAYDSWQKNKVSQATAIHPQEHPVVERGLNTALGQNGKSEASFSDAKVFNDEFQVRIIKAMVAAAHADGLIDEVEQQRIFKTVSDMALSPEVKGLVFELLNQPVSIEELCYGVYTIEHKTELYLASCLAIDLDTQQEQLHLTNLEHRLDLPTGLAMELRQQANAIAV